jgi:hypothetical protein
LTIANRVEEIEVCTFDGLSTSLFADGGMDGNNLRIDDTNYISRICPVIEWC